MFSALLLSAFAFGTPPAPVVSPAASHDDPAIRIWLSNDGRYQRGDQAKVQVKTRDDGYLLVLNVDPDGRVRVLFPLDPRDDDFVRGGKKYQIVSRGGREGFDVSNRSGQGTVYAAVSRAPFRFDGYVVGDHWDFSALDDIRISDKPETELNEFVRRIAGGDFDYDVLGYDVFEHVVYGNPDAVLYDDHVYDYGYGYPGWGYGGCGYWGCGGTSIFIGVGFGRPFRPFFFDPFFDPFFFNPFFFNPFFFDPFFFDPFFFRPFPVFPRFPHPGFFFPTRPFPVRPFGGGFFASPWRVRGGDPLAPGGFQWWRGRQATFGSSAVLASAYRSGFGRRLVVPARAPTATPVRGTVATTDAGTTRRRSLDMTPGRIESARSRSRIIQPTETASGPVARRAVDRKETWGGRVADGVSARGNDGGRRASPQDWGGSPQARPSRAEIIRRDRAEAGRVDTRGYEGSRVIESRPQARRADDDRPASRPNIESRRMDEPVPSRMERGEPAPSMERSQPRMERSEPAPGRQEFRSAEPRGERSQGGGGRSAPAERGGGGGGGGNRGGGGGWGGGGGGWRR